MLMMPTKMDVVKMIILLMMMILTISQTLWLKCPLEPSPRPNTSLLHPWSLFMGACRTPKGQTPVEIFGPTPDHACGTIEGKKRARHVRTKIGQLSADFSQSLSLLCSKLSWVTRVKAAPLQLASLSSRILPLPIPTKLVDTSKSHQP